MKKIILSIMSLFLLLTICSCANKNSVVNGANGEKAIATSSKAPSVSSKEKENSETVTDEVSFNVMDSQNKPLADVKIVLINMNGDMLAIETSDKNGKVIKKLTVPIDKRYYWTDPNMVDPRGTVTTIAFKEGYREQVIFEVPVRYVGSSQEVHLNPVIEGQRNEPDVEAGNSHHLEIISLVDKYSKYFKK